MFTVSHGKKNLLQVQRELNDCERKVSLMNLIVTETKELQDLTIYPYKYYTGAVVFIVSAFQVTQPKILE